MRVGFTNGCFDLLHDGHRVFLTECRRHCDYLVVAVNSDDYCRRVKGLDRPYDPLHVRMLHVRSFAEAVIPFEGRERDLIFQIRPAVVFKGSDYAKNGQHVYIAGGWSCAVVYLDRTADQSTTLEAVRRGLTSPPK